MKRTIFFVLALIAMALFAYTQYLIYFVAELDGQMFFSQKIFYYHVPSAFMLFVATLACGIFSLLYVRKRKGKYDDIALAAGEIAVLFGLIVLVTGSIWGRAYWGVWWEWDARMTMSLLLWMSMLGYVLVRKYGGPGSERLASGLAIFAAVNIPLVYFSVRIWRTLHPKTSVVPGLEGGMKTAFLLSLLLFVCFFTILLWVRISVAKGDRRLNEVREAGLDAGLFE